MSSVVRCTTESVRVRIAGLPPCPPPACYFRSTLSLSLHSSTLRVTNNLKVEFLSIFQLSQGTGELQFSREVFIPSDKLTLSLKELFPGVWVRQGDKLVALDVSRKREFSPSVEVEGKNSTR